MRVAISYHVYVDDAFRRGIRLFYGKPGLANRDEIKRWFEAYGNSMNDDLYASAQSEEEDKS